VGIGWCKFELVVGLLCLGLEWAVDGASKLRCLMMQRVLVAHACQGAVLRRMISPFCQEDVSYA
jgi:hypothetical protein